MCHTVCGIGVRACAHSHAAMEVCNGASARGEQMAKKFSNCADCENFHHIRLVLFMHYATHQAAGLLSLAIELNTFPQDEWATLHSCCKITTVCVVSIKNNTTLTMLLRYNISVLW